ncbi:HAD family hydrolase [Anaplasmataceae bacterium AB001_6]|nr:HAD family hydrolase [Anaplasmataceae bacterium AB001_6]
MLKKVTKMPFAPKAILFDWDNTIVDVDHLISYAMQETYKHFGKDTTDIELYRGPREVFFNRVFGEDKDSASKFFRSKLYGLDPQRTDLFDNVVEVLQLIKDSGICCALISNKSGDILRKEVSFFQLDKFFKTVVGSGDAEADKPSPAPIIFAMKDLDIELDSHVYYIGDSITDYICAIEAGITPILYGDSNAENIPHDVIYVSDHFDLYDVIRNSI